MRTRSVLLGLWFLQLSIAIVFDSIWYALPALAVGFAWLYSLLTEAAKRL